MLTKHPFIAIPAKFLGRITMGAIWGVLLSPFAQDVKLAVAACLAVLALSLYPFFVGWDQAPRTVARLALHGLLMAGEGLAAGAIVLAALAAFSGHTEWLSAMVPVMFGAIVFTLYPTAVMYRDNMAKRRDQRR